MGKYSNFSTPEGAHLGYHPPTDKGSVLYSEYILQIFLFFSLLHLCVYAHTHMHTKVISITADPHHLRTCVCVCV